MILPHDIKRSQLSMQRQYRTLDGMILYAHPSTMLTLVLL